MVIARKWEAKVLINKVYKYLVINIEKVQNCSSLKKYCETDFKDKCHALHTKNIIITYGLN